MQDQLALSLPNPGLQGSVCLNARAFPPTLVPAEYVARVASYLRKWASPGLAAFVELCVSRRRAFHRNHVVRLAIRHQLRHTLRVNAVDVAVCVQDQFSSVAVALPLRDDLHVNPLLN